MRKARKWPAANPPSRADISIMTIRRYFARVCEEGCVVASAFIHAKSHASDWSDWSYRPINPLRT